jgi:photosystem II stability/assembly factor-like uncharacterized protein
MVYSKKIVLFFLIYLFFIPLALLSEWIPLKNYDYSVEIKGIKSINRDNCIVIGSIHQELACFIDQTKDGGLSWRRIYLDSSYQKNKDVYIATKLYSVSYVDSNLIIAVGDSGLIVRSTDDGLTWQKIQLEKNKLLYKIKMKDQYNGIILSGFYDRFYAELHKTTDGGLTWKKMNIPKELKWFCYYDFQMINDSTLLLNGKPEDEEPCIIYVINDFEKYNMLLYYKNPDHKYQYESMSFIDSKKGWIAGGTDILKTTDGGINWNILTFPGKLIRKIEFVNDNFGIAIGMQFTSLFTYNSGLSWHENSLNVGNKLVGMIDFDFADSNTIYFCTYQNVFKFSGILNNDEVKLDDPNVFKIDDMIKLTEKIRIELLHNGNAIPYNVKIFNIQGQELFELNNQESDIELTTGNCKIFHSGLYFIIIYTAKHSYSFKILIF